MKNFDKPNELLSAMTIYIFFIMEGGPINFVEKYERSARCDKPQQIKTEKA
jgi:hypothetical protein